jgi:hypothetical protein
MIMPMPQMYHTHDSRLKGIAIVKALFNYNSAGDGDFLSGVQLNTPKSLWPAVHVSARDKLKCAVGAANCYDVWSIADE